MQLVRKKTLAKMSSMIAAPIFFLILIFNVLNLRIVEQNAKELTLSAFGYNYQGQAFTGLIFERFSTWQLSRISFVYRGFLHGPQTFWYENGQMWIQRNYSYGKEQGEQKAWHPDGKVFYLKHFEQGIAQGEFFEWFKNGELASYSVYKDGVEIAAKTWTGGGKPFYNYVWNNNQRIGLQGDRYCSMIK